MSQETSDFECTADILIDKQRRIFLTVRTFLYSIAMSIRIIGSVVNRFANACKYTTNINNIFKLSLFWSIEKQLIVSRRFRIASKFERFAFKAYRRASTRYVLTVYNNTPRQTRSFVNFLFQIRDMRSKMDGFFQKRKKAKRKGWSPWNLHKTRND